jgi:hypothetical protein
MPLKHAANIEPGGAPDLILQHLELKGAATVAQLSDALDIEKRYVSSTCTRLLDLKAVHRPAWELPDESCRDKRLRAVYAFGPGENAEKPAPKGRPAARAKWNSKRASQRMNYFGAGIGKVNSVFHLAGISGDRKDLDHDPTN